MISVRRTFLVIGLLIALMAPQLVLTTQGSSEPADTDQDHNYPDVTLVDRQLGFGARGESVDALQEYLEQLGFLEHGAFEHGLFDAATRDALIWFQGHYGLQETGTVNAETQALIQSPRYDYDRDVDPASDGIIAQYVLTGGSWDNPNLTYAFNKFTSDLSQAAQKSAMQQALNTWAAATPLTFTEVALNQNPKIVISFESGNHGDGYSFDGPSGILAHAFFPPGGTDPSGTSLHGDAHFDDAETWTVNIPVPAGGIDLVTVAIHEFGHSLGLNHSNDPTAIMYAYYGGASRSLKSDDIAGIQAIYGASGGGTTVDAQVTSISMSPANVTAGTAVTGTVQVRNNGSQAAAIPVSVSGPAGFSYSTTTSSVASGQSTSFTFQWTPASAGNFTLTASANLSGDSNSANNSATSNTVQVSNPTQTTDAQVVSASASPTSITQNSGNVTITASIRNNGSSSTTIPVSVSGPNGYSNSTSRTLASGASATVQFAWGAAIAGSHSFTVTTSLAGDQNASNNSRATNNVTVNAQPSGQALYVSNVAVNATPSGGGHTLTSVVSLGPSAGTASNAFMYGYFFFPNGQYQLKYAYANSAGQVTVQTTTTQTGQHRFQVYSVSKAGYQYNASLNTGNPGVVTVGGGAPPPPPATVDASVNQVTVNPNSIALNGGNVTISATVANNGTNSASIPVSISGPNSFSSSQNVSVNAGATQQVNFSWPASVAGDHTFTVTTNLSSDSNSSNNQRTGPTVSVTQTSVIDAEVVTLQASTGSVQQNGSAVTFTANVRNNGSSGATFTVRLSSQSAGVNTAQSVTLASGASQNIQFQWNPSVVGNHTFTATSELANDASAANNSKTAAVNVSAPPPPAANQIYVTQTYAYKTGSNWIVYVFLGSTNGAVGSGASIVATVRNQYGSTRYYSAQTYASGYASFYVSSVGAGTHTFTVTNISYNSHTYNQALDTGNPKILP